MSEHQRWGSRCRFVRKQPCGNVPVGVDPSTIPLPAPRGQDVCGLGPYRLDYRPSAEADIHGASSSTSHQQGHLPSVARLGILGINVVKKPDHPNYTSYEARLQTYSDWPISMAQSKEQMAEAGFFYLGTGDKTSCYHCGGGIRNWEPQDDPWVTHAKWFSTCSHVRLVKGQEFIDSVTGRQVAPLSGEVSCLIFQIKKIFMLFTFSPPIVHLTVRSGFSVLEISRLLNRSFPRSEDYNFPCKFSRFLYFLQPMHDRRLSISPTPFYKNECIMLLTYDFFLSRKPEI